MPQKFHAPATLGRSVRSVAILLGSDSAKACCNSIQKYKRYSGGTNVIRATLLVIAIGLVTSSASAMPFVQRSAIAHSDNMVNVKIVCERDGRCYQRGR